MVKSLQQVSVVVNPDIKHWLQIIDWCSKTEGWMFMADDYSTWMNSFEKFWYFMAIDNDSQEAVGSVCLAYDCSLSRDPDEDLYYVGMYYVRPEWRQSGLGTMLFEKALEVAGDANTVLNGVMNMTNRYAGKYSFNKLVGYRHNFASISTENLRIPKSYSQYLIKDLKEVNELDVIAYDADISHRNRSKYFLNYITTGKCFTKVALDSSGKVIGIGCIRVTYSNDLCTGPLFADNEEVARSLLIGILSMIPNLTEYKKFASLYPAINQDATRLFESIGNGHMEIIPFSQCQFTKKVFPTEDMKVYGITECACSIV